MWALAVVLGSHCIQCHTGYIVVVLGMLGVGVLWALVLAWRSRSTERSTWVPTLRSMGGAAVAGVAMWLLPLIDQLTRSPGNASILLQHFGSPDEPFIGKRDALEALLNQFSVIGPWITGPELPWVSVPAVIAFALLWGAALVIAWRRKVRSELQVHVLLLVAALLGALSVSRIFGPYFEYTVRWLWIVVASITAASVGTLARAWVDAKPERATRTAQWPRAAALLVVAIALVASVQFGSRAGVAGVGDGRLVGGLADDVETALSKGPHYLLRWWDPAGLGGPGFGLQLELERRGIAVGVDEQFSAASLPHRVLAEQAADAVLYLVIGPKVDEVRDTEGLPGDRLVRSAHTGRAAAFRGAAHRAHPTAGRGRSAGARRCPRRPVRPGSSDLRRPPLPPDVATMAGEFVDLRQPGVVFLAPPGTAIPALASPDSPTRVREPEAASEIALPHPVGSTGRAPPATRPAADSPHGSPVRWCVRPWRGSDDHRRRAPSGRACGTGRRGPWPRRGCRRRASIRASGS